MFEGVKLSDVIGGTPARMRQQMGRNVLAAVPIYKAALIETLSVEGSRLNRSVPGEAPRKQSGRLVESAFAYGNFVALEVVIGVKAAHGAKLAPTRPFLEIAVERAHPKAFPILTNIPADL